MSPDLETFMLDPANRPAALAARAVADASGLPSAPLVVIGPAGSGKTELLRAIAARLRARHPAATVELFGAGMLTERWRAAQAQGRAEAFRTALAEADLVLLDEFERLARRSDGQGLVADLLDARRAAGRETVIASTQPASELPGLDARVVRRLAEGATVTLALPGSPARLGILQRRLGDTPGVLAADTVRALAEAEFASMRDYTGALARLVAFQEASAVPLTPRDALLLIGAPAPPELPAAEMPVAPDVFFTEPGPGDEFGAFLSEVTATVSEQVDRWRRRVGEAIMRWGGEGIRTRRLEALLHDQVPSDPDAVLVEFESDAREIQLLAGQAAELAPDLGGAELFHDPDQVAAARALVEQARSRTAPLSAPLAHFRLEDLAEGPSNREALREVRDLLTNAGRGATPLLIVGPAGTGKTHLVHAIGNALASRGVGPVSCLGGQAFAAELPPPDDPERLGRWRSRYQWAGAFLLDDLHLLAGDRRAQQELARLLLELFEGRRPVLFSSARPLDQLPGLEADLDRALRASIQVSLEAPDREIRLAVAKSLLALTPASRDAALADYLAGRPAESVRAVHAAVQRVLAAAAAERVVPSPSLAREVLESVGMGPKGARRGSAVRASGIRSPGAGMSREAEKLITRWPSVRDLLIGEIR